MFKYFKKYYFQLKIYEVAKNKQLELYAILFFLVFRLNLCAFFFIYNLINGVNFSSSHSLIIYVVQFEDIAAQFIGFQNCMHKIFLILSF